MRRRFILQEKWLKPMGFGRILDRSLQIYRKMFVKLLLLVLILYCPIYLIEGIFYSQADYNLFSFDFTNLSQVNQTVQAPVSEVDPIQIGMFILLFIVLGIAMVALFPIAVSAVLFLVESINKGLPAGIGGLLSRAFKRFWALLGSSLLYGLILSAVSSVFVVALVIVIAIFTFIGGQGFLNGGFATPVAAIGLIIGIIILYALIYIVLGFFAIRWGFYLPFVAMKEDGVGVGRSWHLTKGSFWRILGILFTTIVITYAVVIIAVLLLSLMPGSILGAVLLVLINVIVSPLILVVYAVTYFDLKVRTEGTDLESMLQNTDIHATAIAQVESIEGHA
jgi:hypothetical protein